MPTCENRTHLLHNPPSPPTIRNGNPRKNQGVERGWKGVGKGLEKGFWGVEVLVGVTGREGRTEVGLTGVLGSYVVVTETEIGTRRSHKLSRYNLDQVLFFWCIVTNHFHHHSSPALCTMENGAYMGVCMCGCLCSWVEILPTTCIYARCQLNLKKLFFVATFFFFPPEASLIWRSFKRNENAGDRFALKFEALRDIV